MKRVIVVDDEPNIGRSLRLILEREGYAVGVCGTAAECRKHPDRSRTDVFLLDVRLPDSSGIDLLKELRASGSTAAVIMISGQATIADAVDATRAGAFDFLEKPLGRDKLLVTLHNAMEQATLRDENARLREVAGVPARMIGSSSLFQRVVEEATLAARSDARVLLQGESGTGKELLAEHIHRNSPFSAGPFVKVNCAAIPTDLIESELFGHEKGAFTGAAGTRRGKFELADSGTLFLDEVGDLHAASQAKLLRVLQEGEFHRVGGEQPLRVSVRVIAATNRDLTKMVADGRFRQDLFYRLSVVPIRVPPLRERTDDIRPLASYFLTEFCSRNNFRPRTLAAEALDILERHCWPGNARELRNVIERMAILSPEGEITPECIPAEIRLRPREPALSSVQAVRQTAEREHLLRALEEENWNVAGAARRLGIERTNLHKRMRALGLVRER